MTQISFKSRLAALVGAGCLLWAAGCEYPYRLSPNAPQPATSADPATIAKGQALFTSNNCSGCHGPDAKGVGAAPNIRTAGSSDIKSALSSVAPMSGIKLADSDIAAIAAYLASLK